MYLNKRIGLKWFVVVFMMCYQHAYSQDKSYIATDSSFTSGIRLLEGMAEDNAQFITVKKYQEDIQYYPEQLTEYRLENGTVYKSKSITVSGQPKKVFLEVLEHGKVTLYYYPEKGMEIFFLEKDSTLFVELTKGGDFRKRISEITKDFDWSSDQVQRVKFGRKSLSKLLSLYNNDQDLPLSGPRFGITAGFSRTSLTVQSGSFNPKFNNVDFVPSSSAIIGGFVDLPIKMSYFSFNAGVTFSKAKFLGNYSSNADIVLEHIAIALPLFLRYTIPSEDWRPFFNVGGIYSYHLKNEYDFLSASNASSNSNVPFIAKGMLGVSLGTGLQRNLSNNRVVSGELRLNRFAGNESTLASKNQFDILVSFSF